jgi:hypothetical protein
LSLPAGSYVANATVQLVNTTNNLAQDNHRVVQCVFVPSGVGDSSWLRLDGADTDSNHGYLNLSSAFSITAPENATLNCFNPGGQTPDSQVEALTVRINATAVDNLTSQ